MVRVSLVLTSLFVGLHQAMPAQLATELSPQVRDRYVRVSAPAFVIQNVTLVDGTGAEARRGMSVVVEEGRIAEVGQRVRIPSDAEILGYSGHTLIPGLVGLHNHMFYTAAGGRVATLAFSGPRLYLGGGVTTIRTTGSIAPYAEINVKAEIEAGRIPGPRMHITAPYITGGRLDPTFPDMTLLHSPEQARRFVAYWGEEGATWIKAYTNIGRAEFMAAVDEAHKAGMSVTGHLCSLTHGEAADLGIDNVEHGLLTATDYNPDKQDDRCPLGNEAGGRRRRREEPRGGGRLPENDRRRSGDDVDSALLGALRAEPAGSRCALPGGHVGRCARGIPGRAGPDRLGSEPARQLRLLPERTGVRAPLRGDGGPAGRRSGSHRQRGGSAGLRRPARDRAVGRGRVHVLAGH